MGETSDDAWMGDALALADQGAAEGEVPVGAVIVRDGALLAGTWNRPIGALDPTAHAEILALRAAAAAEGAYRLPGTTLYVTLEPCPMCVGAIIHARVSRLVFGASDPKTGACGGAMDLVGDASHNHHPEVIGGIRGDAGGERLHRFFRERRGRAG